ncbi:bifunctional riboflavin kinase/FAD synthetase [Bacillus sp. CGMCC 1.16607]|uniref:bifunctional riboflavin kinase/FAD synthetase n=1 Tax=Bacillus sp. CGMCC 1.16607 TaxID=3351842 RepID=UPI0036456DB6
MEVIKLQHPHQISQMPPLSVALGFFDGVHLGHQRVILEAKNEANKLGIKSGVMTFDPHPSVVLGKSEKHVEYISPIEDKIQIIQDLGIDYLIIVRFSLEFSHLLPQEFIDQYVIGLNIKHVVAGFDYSYGKMGKGTMETIPFHSRDRFTYTVISKLSIEGEKISSTLIRKLITNGDTDKLPSLLGRYYQTSGKVIHGDKRGRTIGFPTANIDLSGEYLLPPIGVYAVRLKVENTWFDGVCNIGYKPTFKKENHHKPSIEVHIFNFDKEIYGFFVTIEWHKYIRKEQKFNGIDELVAQIQLDKEHAMEHLEKISVS